MKLPCPFLSGCLLVSLLAVSACAASWEVTNLAGAGVAGFSGDGGQAAAAKLNQPFGLVRGPDGALYVCEFEGNVVRRIGRDGVITTVIGSGRRGGGGDGGPALQAEFDQPHEIRFDTAGNLFLADMRNHRIRRVDAKSRIVTTVAGTGEAGFSGDGGPATQAKLNNPISLQFDAHGDLFLCDIGNHRVRKIDLRSGLITTITGTGARAPSPDGGKFADAPLNGPRTLDFDREGNLWLALREGNQVFRFDMKAGTLHHVAGTGAKGFTGDGGPAKAATLSGPKGIAVGPDGGVYLADTESHNIRRIDPKRGVIELVAGTGEKGDGPAGDGAKCQLARPHGVFVDTDGVVYVGDSENHRVRMIRPAQ